MEHLQFGGLHIRAEVDKLDDVLWTRVQDREQPGGAAGWRTRYLGGYYQEAWQEEKPDLFCVAPRRRAGSVTYSSCVLRPA